MNERIDEGVLQWLGHVERKDNGRIAKRVYVGGSVQVVTQKVGHARDGIKDCLKIRGLGVSQAGKMVYIGVNGGGL